jgi:hypothetical protein
VKARIDRLVVRTVLVCTALAGLAFAHNHQAHPCGDTQVGAGEMCVTVSAAGGAL